MVNVKRCTSAEFYGVFNIVWPDQAEDASVADQGSLTLPEEHRPKYWGAYIGNLQVGAMEVGHDLGSFHPSRWQVDISVLPEQRRKGFGSALANKAERFLEGREIELLTTRVQDDAQSIRFANGLRFEEVKRDFWSVLDLTSVDFALVQTMRAGLPSDVRLLPFEAVDSPENRRAIHVLFEEVRMDLPRVAPPTPLSFDHYESLVLSDPFLDRECSTYALRGNEFLASSIGFNGTQEGLLEQGLTAVRKAARGQGIGKAIKAEVILCARARGYRQLKTDNDSRNHAILAINDRLGFKRLPATITMARRA